MLNIIWVGLMVLAVIFGIINGRLDDVVVAVTDYAKLAFDIALGLAGILVLWLGLMNIANEAGLIQRLATLLSRPMRLLFPDVPEGHPAIAAMVLNMAANILGLGNAATPLGIKAMQSLETINQHPGVATDAMCMFLAINTSSIQLVPATAIAFLAANNAARPAEVIVTALLATACSTVVAIVVAKLCSKLKYYQIVNLP